MSKATEFFDTLNDEFPFWWAPVMWGIEFAFWIMYGDHMDDAHWTTEVILALVMTSIIIITIVPLLALNVVLWATALPCVIVYAIIRQIVKIFR